MGKLIQKTAILAAGLSVMIGGVIAVGILFVFAFAVVLARRILPRVALVRNS